jgi:hypothetical protein
MVSIENLKDSAKEWPNLAALVHWISDTSTVNKLRINCHGQGTKTGGFSMGTVTLSAAEFVDALVRHGLTRPGTDAAPAPGLLQGARWKADSEKAACEKCNKPFSIMRRRHHCRRCGGLFCDACSSKKADLAVALTEESRTGVGQHYATAKNVKKARVCDACYEATMTGAAAVADAIARRGREIAASADLTNPSLANNGLKTITLALCMGARTEGEFSPERDPELNLGTLFGQQDAGVLIRDSLAGRVLEELRRRNLRGIKIAASNQIVAGTDDGIENRCGVVYPTDDYQAHGKKCDVRKKYFAANTSTFDFPAYIFGSRTDLKTQYKKWEQQASLPTQQGISYPKFKKGITVSPCGRSLHFSEGDRDRDLDYVNKYFLSAWKFTSWQTNRIALPSQPGGSATKYTWKITAPPRVTGIKLDLATPTGDRINLTGRDVDSFKHYKSYEVS